MDGDRQIRDKGSAPSEGCSLRRIGRTNKKPPAIRERRCEEGFPDDGGCDPKQATTPECVRPPESEEAERSGLPARRGTTPLHPTSSMGGYWCRGVVRWQQQQRDDQEGDEEEKEAVLHAGCGPQFQLFTY